MGLDIRLPIGLMFTVLGAMLIIFGIILGESAMRVGVNINIWWGVAMLGFGGIMLALARRRTSAMHSAPPEPDPEQQQSRGH